MNILGLKNYFCQIQVLFDFILNCYLCTYLWFSFPPASPLRYKVVLRHSFVVTWVGETTNCTPGVDTPTNVYKYKYKKLVCVLVDPLLVKDVSC